ncbi:cache domain-containing sensor histidine kinase [Cohnella candidum]|uniref:Sensor histidine kinase n=1 Tax=Cohnella candidum TaxID=2674991 RepID=A0A3G3K4B5_9BACL|nr:sensor histidine kinase [Cohnella candidum]AYQ75282.1 sensor histidine kinase [Cohnella candidum]
MPNRTIGLSLRTKTLIYLMAIVTPIFVFSWYASVVSGNETKKQVGSALLQLAKQTHTTLDRDILGISENTIKMIQEPLVQSMAKEMAGTPFELVRQYVALGELMNKYGVSDSFYSGLKYSLLIPVNDPSRYKFAPSYQQLANGVFFVDPKTSPWYKTVFDLKGKGNLQVLDHFGAQGAGKSLTFLRVVKDFATDLKTDIGIIAVTDLQTVLSNDMKAIELPESSEIYFTDRDNRILASKTNKQMGEKVRIPGEWLKQEESNSVVTLDQKTYLLAYHRSYPYDTKLIILTPVSIITSQATQTHRLIVFITAFYVFLILLTVSLFIRTFLRPLRKLGALVRSFVPGKELVLAHPPGRKRDEIGELTLSFFRMTRRLNEMIHERYVMEIKQKETELSMLQQQINPHLLYNTLESIYWHGIALGQKDVAEMVKDLSKLMRIGLSRGRDVISIGEEIEHAEAYLRLQQRRDKTAFRVEWEIDEACLQAQIPKITLQPLLENAIQHGVAKMEEEGRIVIRIRRMDEADIEITVSDNGYKPVDSNRLNAIAGEESPNEGYGIRNVQKRLKLHFGDRYGLFYESNPGGGVTARITIPDQERSGETGGEHHA